uniref:Uncharacterized protein n=1 Tax=Rhizophora mucronata TaxID=61149 RepID=A0A2P2M4M2_RHIMU
MTKIAVKLKRWLKEEAIVPFFLCSFYFMPCVTSELGS